MTKDDAMNMTAAARITDVISFGPFSLVASERLLLKAGVPVKLSARALDTLIALVSRPNEVIGKKDLIAQVWPDVTVEEGSLRFHIAGLRKALGDGKDGARYITTLPGRGYCFVARTSISTESNEISSFDRSVGDHGRLSVETVMEQVVELLEKLGMPGYVQRFADNGIDFSVLRDLNDQDLKDLGVVLGDRRKLLRAIAELETVSTATGSSGAAASQDAAERRQLTVMFCDLAGSTELSGRLDPEDLRETICAYQRCCAKLVERNGGFVAKYMGDGMLAYFGYPQAHEDDAERAVQAGLAIVETIPELVTAAGSPLQVRVGIATGLVVVGDLIGTGEAQERGVVGETPNLAARLQAIAEPNMIVIADDTRRLLGDLFELQDLGVWNFKGMTQVRAWAALRARSVESRFEALHASGGLVALVGREEEFELLVRRWSRAKTGEGQVVLLSGEAGIGKSRLTAALLERLAPEPHARLRYFCSPQHTDSAFYPIISQMERAAGLTYEDAPQAKRNKLDAMLARTATSAEDAALFAEMMSLPNDGRNSAVDLTPQQRRKGTLEALIAHMEALARLRPLLMIFEDAHWADPTSLEMLGRAVDRIASLPVLLIVTSRPDFKPRWIGQPHVTTLTINRLARRDVDTMIDRISGSDFLPESIRHDILERADGIPLFVEEMTKAALETGR